MNGFTTRFNPRVSRYLWTAWLLFTLALTVKPFVRHVRYFESPGPEFYKLILIVLPLLAVTVAVYRSLRRKTLWRYEPLLLGGLLLGAALLYEPLATLVTLWTVTVCYASGRFVLDRLGLATDSHTEEIALPSAIGFGLLSFALFLLGIVDGYYVWSFCLLLGIPTIVFRRQILQLPREFWGIYQNWRADSRLSGTFIGVLMVFAALFLLFTIMLTLAPSINMDMMLFHLGEVRHYAMQNGLEAVPRMPYSYFPKGGEVLWTFGYVLAGQAGAQMVHPTIFLLTLLLAYPLARRCGVGRVPAIAGILLAGTIPFLHWTGSSFKNDFLVFLYQLGALFCYLRSREEAGRPWLYVGVFLLASSLGVKHTACFGAMPLGLLYLYASWRKPRLLAALFCLGLFFGFYWHARTYAITGNPFYPASVKNATPELPNMQGVRPPVWLMFLQYPWVTHFEGSKCFESPSDNPCGMFLVFFVPMWLLVRRKKKHADERICLLFVLIYLLYLGYVWMIIRYAIPTFIILFLLTIVRTFVLYETSGKWTRGLIEGALAYSMMFAMLPAMITEINGPQLRYFAGQMDKHQYLTETVRYYGAVDYLGDHVKPDSLILSLDNAARGYAPKPAQFHFISCRAGLKRCTGNARQFLARYDYDFVVLPTVFTRRFEELMRDSYQIEQAYRDDHYSVYRIQKGQG